MTDLAATVDLILISLNRSGHRDDPAEQGILIPQYVRQIRDAIAPDANPFKTLCTHGNTRELSKIRRNGFTYSLSTDASLLPTFYHEFFLPFILDRHGDEAFTQTFDQCQREFEEGELLSVLDRNGRTVVGTLVQTRGDTWFIRFFGVRDADFALVRQGGLAAAWLFCIVEASKRGCRHIDFGLSRPFLDQGVLFYKKKWGGWIATHPGASRPLRMLFCNSNPRAHRFIEENPLITQRGNLLEGVLALGDHVHLSDVELFAHLKRCGHPGLLALSVVLLTPAWAARRGAIEQLEGKTGLPLRIVDLSSTGGPLRAGHLEHGHS